MLRTVKADQISELPFGSVIRVVWLESDTHETHSDYKGVIHGKKVGWADGTTEDLDVVMKDLADGKCSCTWIIPNKLSCEEDMFKVTIDDEEEYVYSYYKLIKSMKKLYGKEVAKAVDIWANNSTLGDSMHMKYLSIYHIARDV